MAETYDIALSSPFPSYHFFVHRIRELCGQMNVSFFQVNDTWVHEFRRKVQSREISVRVLLDLTANHTVPDDPYLLLAKEVKRQHGYVIDDPDITAATMHKGQFHQLLLDNGILVPKTIVVNRRELQSFRITREVQAQVGETFVVKPAWASPGAGVVVDAQSEEELLWSAEQAPQSDSFLVQQRLQPKELGRHLGWFRVFHICREVIACWWDPVSHEYQLVTPAQIRNHHLAPLRPIMRSIARISRMRKFTSEICLHEDGRFYAVDYVNADSDLNPRAFHPNDVPDEVVRHIVWLLFYEGLHIVKRGHGFFDDDADFSDIEAAESGLSWSEDRRRARQARHF